MDHDFWHAKWGRNEIGFHRSDVNPLLVDHFEVLSLSGGERIFLPLCGKTLDIRWLLTNGFRVAGAELNGLAVRQLFDELGIEPDVSRLATGEHYRADGIDIFLGDIFDLSRETLGPVDAVYDRAALVALPETMRADYAAHVATITVQSPQLLVCYEYDQAKHAGPPFSVDANEVERCYSQLFTLQCLSTLEVPGGLKGMHPATESVWLLRSKTQPI